MTISIVALLAFTISTVGALILIKRNSKIDQRATQVMAFVLYFWLISFLQVLLWGIGYYL